MPITWGDITFTTPVRITTWDPPYRAAIYAISIRTSDEFSPIYFGESGNLDQRGFYRSHHKYSCFLREVGSDENIYISIHLLPNSTEDERREIERRLISQYNPVCNY